jgi:hypothetical protein
MLRFKDDVRLCRRLQPDVDPDRKSIGMHYGHRDQRRKQQSHAAGALYTHHRNPATIS